MLYDLADGPPKPGTLLESIFLVLVNRRQEQEFIKTRLLVEAALAPHSEKHNLEKIFEQYTAQAFPHLEKKDDKEEEKKALAAWTAHDKLVIRPLWDAAPERLKAASKLRGARDRVKKMEEDRKKDRLRRLDE